MNRDIVYTQQARYGSSSALACADTAVSVIRDHDATGIVSGGTLKSNRTPVQRTRDPFCGLNTAGKMQAHVSKEVDDRRIPLRDLQIESNVGHMSRKVVPRHKEMFAPCI